MGTSSTPCNGTHRLAHGGEPAIGQRLTIGRLIDHLLDHRAALAIRVADAVADERCETVAVDAQLCRDIGRTLEILSRFPRHWPVDGAAA
jgi:hypothetical protein